MGLGLESRCGVCSGFWRWFKPPHYNFFKIPCQIHDYEYDLGVDRKKADIRLFQNMVEEVLKYYKGRKVTSQYWLISLSFMYYIVVRVMGEKYFNKQK